MALSQLLPWEETFPKPSPRVFRPLTTRTIPLGIRTPTTRTIRTPRRCSFSWGRRCG